MRSENKERKQAGTMKRCGWLNELMWSCAGVNKKILRQCPGDYAKYAGIGGTILFTALMAMLSGGYAMNFVFDDIRVSIAFGIFWGLLIFNLDRFIVNTIYSDGKHSISWAELKSGLPRIIMAIFLGIVISTPLEMKIFEDRINSQIELDNEKNKNKVLEEAIGDLENRRKELDREYNSLNQRLDKAQEEMNKEYEGRGNGGPGIGKYYNDKKDYRDKIQKQLEAKGKELENLVQQINEKTKEVEGNFENSVEKKGFCVRYEAFSNIRADNKSLNIVSWVIMLLFIIIETAPTFFRMMMEDGPYENMLNAYKHEVNVLSQKQMSDINDEINTEIQISTQKNKERLHAEILANKELMNKISTAQAELLQSAIDAWASEELEKIKENPSRYITSNYNDGADGAKDSEATEETAGAIEETEETEETENIEQ